MISDNEFVDLTYTSRVPYGIIDVRGRDFDSALLVAGKAIALNWMSDPVGHLGQYLVRAGRTNYESKLAALRHTLEGNLCGDVPLSSQLHAFLELLVPGQYLIQYHSEFAPFKCLEYKANLDPTVYDHFYPSRDPLLVFTQPSDTLNQDRVSHYVKTIQSGQRPIAITARVDLGVCDFVLDGHHKLQGYKTTRIAPAVIRICRINAPRLSAASFEKYFRVKHPMSSHYRQVKTKYDA